MRFYYILYFLIHLIFIQGKNHSKGFKELKIQKMFFYFYKRDLAFFTFFFENILMQYSTNVEQNNNVMNYSESLT